MNKLEQLALRKLEDYIYEAIKDCNENKDSERECKNVVPFISRKLIEACKIIDALKENQQPQ